MHIPTVAGEKDVEINMFVDSGAGGIFIHPRMAIKLRLESKRLAKSILVYNVDNTPNKLGKITHEVTIPVRMGTEARKIKAWIADIGREDVILGLPWLKQENPNIDWEHGRVTLKHRKTWTEIVATAKKRIEGWTARKIAAASVAIPTNPRPSTLIEEIPDEETRSDPGAEDPDQGNSIGTDPETSPADPLDFSEGDEVIVSYVQGESFIGIHTPQEPSLTQEAIDGFPAPRICSTVNRFTHSLG